MKDKLKHKQMIGLLVKIIAHPATLIMAKEEGMDFVFYDCEHGILSYETLHDLMVMGNGMALPSIVRVPQLARGDVSKILDYGATGVMVPMIETKEQAQQLVAWSKYPPIGKRSYSGGANTHYAVSGNHAKNMQVMNQKTMSIVQIESVIGVEHIDEILSVNGIDAAIIGPCDLGISMNNPDNVMDDAELKLIKKVADACKKHEKAFGIIGGLELLTYFKEDIDIIISAIDLNILRKGIHQAVEETKQVWKGII